LGYSGSDSERGLGVIAVANQVIDKIADFLGKMYFKTIIG